ncbi:MAG: hypothetical protein R3C71_02075 [Candidatus Krumholzibacteriia bacterium]|nr:hypothetical protein [bacterium]
MRSRSARLKGFRRWRTVAPAVLLLAAGLAGCASNPTPPDDSNHAPQVTQISILGDKPVVAAGSFNVTLQAQTADVDGDALTLSWSGPGNFHGVNNAAKTVLWDVPADQYGDLTVTCTASDGDLSGSRDRSFAVGRAITAADYGTPVNGTITWSTADSPFYILKVPVDIPVDVKLVIAPGTTIWCESASQLSVLGELEALGTSTQQITFKPYAAPTTLQDYWLGVSMEAGARAANLEWCNIYNANVGLSLALGTQDPALVSIVYFLNCKKGVVAGFGGVEVSGCRIEGFAQGVVADDCEVDIHNCTFVDGSESSLILRGGSTGPCTGNVMTDVAAPIVNLAASYPQLNYNSFYGTGVAIAVGGGYGTDPAPVDARCNYWGDGLSEGGVVGRISISGTDPADVLYDPWRDSVSADCSF